jgi:hypothetical protein
MNEPCGPRREPLARCARELGLDVLPGEGDAVGVRGARLAWLHDALVGLGHAAAVRDGSLWLAVPADDAALAGLAAAMRAAMAPQALLLDLDGVLADLVGRTALAAVGTVQALAAVLPLGVVTTCPQRLAAAVLARHGFAPFVRVLVAAEDAPPKPDPAPVRLALQQLGVAAAWMVGDNPSDVEAARAAGVVPLAIAPRGIGAEAHAERLRAAGAVRLVRDLADVIALLP